MTASGRGGFGTMVVFSGLAKLRGRGSDPAIMGFVFVGSDNAGGGCEIGAWAGLFVTVRAMLRG